MAIVSRTEDLEILLAVIDSGSFSAAARNLDIQVARVSRAVSRLEQELDCTLLNRTTRKLELTEEGRQFSEQARAGLDRLAEAEENIRALRGIPAGRLRVDAATPFMLHQLVPLVPGFRERYPQIKLELVASESIIDLIERRTDLAIRIGALQDSNLHARFLGRSPLHIVASPDYLEKHGTPQGPEALGRHQIIGFVDAPHLNRWPLSPPMTVIPSLSSSSGETIRQLCLDGQGLALLSDFMICDDLASGRLIKVLDERITTPNNRELVHAVYYRNTTLSSRITAFLDYIGPRLRLG
ncbi:LysR family transcriptional regulator [Oceanisphaera psychrotolerans]|uniref:LysR family transcriptional regulator n=1 Tax=Oceanisphaera psychrotolerans TaxID=1414654 RepID=A0A1J4QDJ6_9GAMM|nr:LysR family transcriptional regulator [Oceanisphaera psychrotolerans]OIN07666.1 LysR family transcriptional regulator [Oceanisphaera psychrotolerans]